MLNIEHQKNDSAEISRVKNSDHYQFFEGTITDTLAQELRAPLGAMLGMLVLLLTTAMSLKQKEYLEVACSSGRSLMSLLLFCKT